MDHIHLQANLSCLERREGVIGEKAFGGAISFFAHETQKIASLSLSRFKCMALNAKLSTSLKDWVWMSLHINPSDSRLCVPVGNWKIVGHFC